MFLSRRRFLQASAGLPALALTGCRSADLQLALPGNTIPAPILRRFQDRTRLTVQLDRWSGLAESSRRLLNDDPTQLPNLVGIGDGWLQQAIASGRLAPFNPNHWRHWTALPQRWRQQLRRDRQGFLSDAGEIWAAPYRWGTTMIAFRRDRLTSPLQDWTDLWRPELRGQLILPDDPREVIGLTLKRLGWSYNQPNLAEIPDLEPLLKSLHQQVKLYSSRNYLQPLLLGDALAAVGWSADILAALRRDSRLSAVVPRSGTSIWLDLWVQPQKRVSEALSDRWIDFGWSPAIAPQFAALGLAASPAVLTAAAIAPAKAAPLQIPPKAILEKSELILPLPETVRDRYLELWQTIRRA
ncbi:extracellular solute-binding protein [Synechococcus elongatus]|uniref:Extracellular solute-binding protein n=1 Tax=Synechococcus elongatus PCC 11801 TaxID=2219813 RepID=A0AAN1QMJ7_SYNEL|nr:extracellular solute-binding protein [Synechococcus elongatus]AZB72104.1 polyamine ABC transporter substrate-binding protein [Synechococcus elongatus PCC 11801]